MKVEPHNALLSRVDISRAELVGGRVFFFPSPFHLFLWPPCQVPRIARVIYGKDWILGARLSIFPWLATGIVPGRCMMLFITSTAPSYSILEPQ